jgi:hypothetical protein
VLLDLVLVLVSKDRVDLLVEVETQPKSHHKVLLQKQAKLEEWDQEKQQEEEM